MIELKNIYKSYYGNNGQTPALTDVSLTVDAGDFVAVMGPSGCGKSTLLNVLGLLDDVDSGQYWFNQNELMHLSESRKDAFRQTHIGFVFQGFNLIDELSIYENVELPLVYAGVGSAERRTRTEGLLEQLSLMHRRHYRPTQLSGGQQQRAAIARAVVTKPSLILADEPTGNLDSTNGDTVMRLLTDLNEGGATIIMVTHSDYDALYAHRVVRMIDGHIL
ncbi:ABC transporter ATP-binding protein [Spirosoma soli]|uniref:ABC transporter ATP-binding protein n=1 Tax=Spirosoma soli TaxID=1770529 RepID=A0ABW5MAM7_9BACT